MRFGFDNEDPCAGLSGIELDRPFGREEDFFMQEELVMRQQQFDSDCPPPFLGEDYCSLNLPFCACSNQYEDPSIL